MTIHIGNNGFGRMGRLALRAGWNKPEFEITRINEIATDANGSAYLLKFDSVHGTWDLVTDSEDGSIIIDGRITNTQTIVDKGHKDLRRSRACGQSLIPTTTGSAMAITKIFPELTGKLNGHAVRVPLLNAALTDFVFEASRPVTVEEVNGYLRDAAEGVLKGILGYEERPLVSIDYLNDPRSSIVDALSTMVIDGTQVKVYAWYDNEWGYVNRMIELGGMVALSLSR